MEVALAGGEVIDVASSADLERMAGHLLSVLTPPVPLSFLQPIAKTTPAVPFTYTFFDLGGPTQPGQEIDVLRYTLFGNDPFAAVAGAVIAFISSVAPADSNLEPTFPNMVDVQTVLPAVAVWSGHQLTLHWQEHLIICAKGLPGATQLIATLQGQRYDRSRFRLT